MNIAFIPVRCGSKSIPLKNIKSFCNKPLVYWSILALQKSKNIDEIYVATDCDEIKSVVNSFEFSKVKLLIMFGVFEDLGMFNYSEFVFLRILGCLNVQT